jgi:hypothetical protein
VPDLHWRLLSTNQGFWLTELTVQDGAARGNRTLNLLLTMQLHCHYAMAASTTTSLIGRLVVNLVCAARNGTQPNH